jgi:outer membrane autotransporter protein
LSAISANIAKDVNDNYLAAMRMHHRNTAWNGVRNHFIRANVNRARNEVRGQSPCAPCETFAPFAVKRVAWASYVGENDTYHSGFNSQDWSISREGVQVGSDLFRTRTSQVGMLFGTTSGRGHNLTDSIENDDVYLGLYGSKIFRNGIDIRGTFAYGWQDYDMRRTLNNNMFTSSFKGETLESTVELGKSFVRGAWSVRPVLGIDVFTNNLDGARESNGGEDIFNDVPVPDGLQYNSSRLTQTFFRTGADLNYQVKGFRFNGGIYYSYDMRGDELQTRITDGTSWATLSGSQLGREVLSFNVGLDIALTQRVNVFGGYQGESVLDCDGVNNAGYVGAAFKW